MENPELYITTKSALISMSAKVLNKMRHVMCLIANAFEVRDVTETLRALGNRMIRLELNGFLIA